MIGILIYCSHTYYMITINNITIIPAVISLPTAYVEIYYILCTFVVSKFHLNRQEIRKNDFILQHDIIDNIIFFYYNMNYYF